MRASIILVLILSIASMAAKKELAAVNVNTAPADSLVAHLPGVGAAIAHRIVEGRADSAYATCDDLAARVRGIGAAKAAKICPLAKF